MSSIVVLKQMVMIFALILIGYFLYKKKLLSDKAAKDLSIIVVNVCSPALIIASMFQDLSGISKRNVAEVTGIGTLYFVLLIAFGYAFVKLFKVPAKEKEAYILMSTFENVGFIGIPVALAILGSSSILYVIIFNFLYDIVIFTFGITLVKKDVEGAKHSLREIIDNLMTPGFLSCIVAVIIYWFNLSVPDTVQSIVNYCANACTFLSMLVIGTSIVGMNPKKVLGNKKLIRFLLIRFLLVPVVTAILLKPILTDYIMRATLILMLALPIGNLPMMLAEQYDKDAHTISEGIILSTIMSVVTITIVFMFV